MAFRHPAQEARLVTAEGEERTLRKTRQGWQMKRDVSTVPLHLTQIVGPLIGARIRAARQSAGLSMSQLCRLSGITSSTPKQRIHEI